MRDDKFNTSSDIVNSHPSKGTQWVLYINQFYFDSYGCPPPKNINVLHKVNTINSFTISNPKTRFIMCFILFVYTISITINWIQKSCFKFILSNKIIIFLNENFRKKFFRKFSFRKFS